MNEVVFAVAKLILGHTPKSVDKVDKTTLALVRNYLESSGIEDCIKHLSDQSKK